MTEYLYIVRPARSDMLISGLTAEEERVIAAHSEYLSKCSELIWLAHRSALALLRPAALIQLNAIEE